MDFVSRNVKREMIWNRSHCSWRVKSVSSTFGGWARLAVRVQSKKHKSSATGPPANPFRMISKAFFPGGDARVHIRGRFRLRSIPWKHKGCNNSCRTLRCPGHCKHRDKWCLGPLPCHPKASGITVWEHADPEYIFAHKAREKLAESDKVNLMPLTSPKPAVFL